MYQIIVHKTSAVYFPTSNAYSEIGVKKCKSALWRAMITGQDTHQLLNRMQELKLSDCNASPKDLFLQRRIKHNSMMHVEDTKPFSWIDEIQGLITHYQILTPWRDQTLTLYLSLPPPLLLPGPPPHSPSKDINYLNLGGWLL